MDLKEFCRQRGTTLKRVAEQANIPLSSAYTIASGTTPLDNVGISVFMRIADVLNCTTDELYIALRDDAPSPYTVRNLTESETALVDNYRALSTAGRSILDGVVQGLLLTHPKNNELRANPRTA